ncbi:unnamed protein product, partial [Ectocarpus sp. 12 AP-2014]
EHDAVGCCEAGVDIQLFRNKLLDRQKSDQDRNNGELVNYTRRRVGNEIKPVHRAFWDNAT